MKNYDSNENNARVMNIPKLFESLIPNELREIANFPPLKLICTIYPLIVFIIVDNPFLQ